jgi:uncharacterized membrane protein
MMLRLTRREWIVIAILMVVGTTLVTIALVSGETFAGLASNFGVGLVSAVVIFVILELVLEHIRETSGHTENGFDYSTWV